MIGVCDFFDVDDFQAWQIVPVGMKHTLDIPDASVPLNASTEPAWKWLKEEWPFEVSEDVTVVTNLDALKGNVITEVVRWEEEEWEMFAGPGPGISKKEIRVVPLGVLFGIDNSLLPALQLEVGKGMRRNSRESEWESCGQGRQEL